MSELLVNDFFTLLTIMTDIMIFTESGIRKGMTQYSRAVGISIFPPPALLTRINHAVPNR